MKVLVVDDERSVRETLAKLLRSRGYEVVLAVDGLEAHAILQQPDAPQLVILDWQLPRMTGIELCREVRRRGLERYTYIVLLTAKNRRDDLLDGFAAGADDYIVKPFDYQELCMRLHAGKRILHLQAQLIATREAFRQQSLRDSLTGLWNCAGIFDILERELARSARQESCVAATLLDLDDFKQINDRHGHLAGDAVLREVAAAIRNATRSIDGIGRQGGDEFLIVLPGCDERGARAYAERIRAAIGQIRIETGSGIVGVTASIGVAVAGPSIDDAYTLLRDADEALFAAKRQGRNRVEIASPVNSGLTLAAC